MEKVMGVIGGSGLDDPKILKNPKELTLTTPYGHPVATLLTGKIGQAKVVVLARLGRTHALPPTINQTDCEAVVIATPIDLARFVKINKPAVRDKYDLADQAAAKLQQILKRENFL